MTVGCLFDSAAIYYIVLMAKLEEKRQQREENEVKSLWNKISNFTTEERAKVVREFKPRATDIML